MKKKGFTLIELLAVIVVLAVIMVIAVPKILEVIENAEKQAYKESAELMAHTATLQYQTKEVTGSAPVIPDEGITYTFAEGVQSVSGNYDLLKFKGDKPYQGTITLTKDKKVIISDLISKNKKWCAKKEANEKSARVGRRTDPDFNCKIEGEDEIVVDDEDPCSLEIDEETGVYYVDSPSDLYQLSKEVNAGNSFLGKTIKVRNNLDMSDTSNTCGETDFSPIGTGTTFQGIFNGGAKIISNLTINKPDQDNVGLFGRVSGQYGKYGSTYSTIYGIILKNASITGRNNVGGLIGSTSMYTNVKEILLDDVHVKGNNHVSSAIGLIDGAGVSNVLVKEATVEGNEENTSITGVVAVVSSGSFSTSIAENVTINGSSIHNGQNFSNNVIINEVKSTNGFETDAIDDINFYEAVGLDTWIGADNDTSGYYFDYDKDGKITLKSIEVNPFPDATKVLTNGSGTAEDPYLVKNTQDWKKISAYANKGLVVKLDSDLDFGTNKYYMLGSYNNKFNSRLIGNDKVISNVTINANTANYIGMIGFINVGTVSGFKVNNLNIKGNNYVGLIGYVCGEWRSYSAAYSNIYGITINNSKIIGNEYVGAFAGSADMYAYAKEILLDGITVKGNNYVSSAIGLIDGTGASNILVKNAIVDKIETNPVNVGVVAIISTGSFSSSIAENVTVSGDSVHNAQNYSNNVIINGINVTDGFESDGIDDINFYEAASLDTWIGGDSDSSGYYFDYDSNGKVILKSTVKDPITFNLKQEDGYYLIENEQDWKEASTRRTEKYKLTNDLDFSTNKYYMLGSYNSQFSGILNGNNKKINNVTISGSKANYIGMIGFVDVGTVYGFEVNNLNIKGNDYVGLIGYMCGEWMGYSAAYSNVYAISIINPTIKGNNYVGGFAGSADMYAYAKEILLDDIDIKGNTYVSSAIGLIDGTQVSNVLVKKGTVEGTSITGVVAIISTGTFGSSIAENVTVSGSEIHNGQYYSNNVIINGTNATDGFDVSNIDNIYYYKDILETLFTGDANGTGYFFDYVEEKGGIYLVKAYTLTPPTNEETGENIGPSTGVCSIYPCTCECGCICNDGSDGATQTRCEAGCN